MGYIHETKDIRTEVVTGATCDQCGTNIPLLEGMPEGSTNLNGGIEIRAYGWYGGLIDTLPPTLPPLEKLLCNDCGTRYLQEWFPEDLP